MIVSHYGLSYIYLFSLIPAWLLLVVREPWPSMMRTIWNDDERYLNRVRCGEEWYA